jgi:hypothetical protein
MNPNLPGKLLAHWMPWTGDPSRVSHVTVYKQTDSGVAASQADCMKASGIDGAVLWWQGPNKAFTNLAFQQMLVACVKQDMPVMVGLDQWIAKNQANPTQIVIDALKSPAFQMAAQFLAEPWILEFDLGKIGVNVAAVQTAVPSLQILSKHVGYSWPETTNTFPTLLTDNAKPTMKVPAVFSRFNDGGYPLPNGVGSPSTFNGQRDWNKSVWGAGPNRIIEERAGRTFLESCAAVPANSKYVGLVTWNDWDEGTAIEGFCSAFSGIQIGT